MNSSPVDSCPDTYLVDNMLFGAPELLGTYLLDAARPVVLDAGTTEGATRILDAMADRGIDPAEVAYLVVSHVHLDHAAGTATLLDACENATVLVHERGVPYLTEADRLARLEASVENAIGMEAPYGEPDLVPLDRCRTVSGGETIDLGDRSLDLYDAPGHAPHQFVCFEPDSGMLFAADAVGAYHPEAGVVPSTPPPSFDLDANLATVDRLRELDPHRILYSHFGPGEAGSATAELDTYAELLPTWVDAVEAAREDVGDDVQQLVDALGPEWPSPTLRRDVMGVLEYLDSYVSRS